MVRISSSAYYQQAVDAINSHQNRLAQIQAQMSSGLRVNTAADDPAAAAQILGVNKSMADIDQWQTNARSLQASLGLEDGALSAVSAALNQINTLALQSNSPTLNATDRAAIAAQMKQQLDVIVQQANARDASGRYLFGGTADGSAPFSLGSSGAGYSGNSNVRMLSLGPTSEIAAGDPGDAVFMQLKSGDGSVSAAAGAANGGSATVSAAQVTDAALYGGGSYTVKFSGGQYQVLDSGNNVVGGGAYTDGAAIRFQGVSLTLRGTPADGDSFSLGPATAQDVFSTVQKLIAVVQAPAGTAAQRAQNGTALYGALQALSGAQAHVTGAQAALGSREQAVNDSVSQLQARTVQLKTTLSGLQDLDYASATTQLSQTQVTLQAAEQSYVQIQGLSLFNYIR